VSYLSTLSFLSCSLAFSLSLAFLSIVFLYLFLIVSWYVWVKLFTLRSSFVFLLFFCFILAASRNVFPFSIVHCQLLLLLLLLLGVNKINKKATFVVSLSLSLILSCGNYCKVVSTFQFSVSVSVSVFKVDNFRCVNFVVVAFVVAFGCCLVPQVEN